MLDLRRAVRKSRSPIGLIICISAPGTSASGNEFRVWGNAMEYVATLESVLADLVLDILRTNAGPVRELDWDATGGSQGRLFVGRTLFDAAFAQGLFVDTQRLRVDIDAQVNVREKWGHERNLEIMSGLLKMAAQAGAEELPAIIVEGEDDPILVDWTNPRALGVDAIRGSPASLFQEFRDGDAWNDRFGRQFLRVSIDAAKRLFAEGFACALVNGGAVAEIGGATMREVDYEVRCVKHGYRVCLTDLYMMSPRVFGSMMSTPVRDRIATGWYRFGGEKSGVITWDHGRHLASSMNRSTHTTRF